MEAKSTERITYVNGRYVPESQAHVHIYDSQFMFGDGVFEMFRTFKGEPFLFVEHIDRLFMSMKTYGITIDKTLLDIKAICDELMRLNVSHFVNDEYRFMINVSRGPLSIYKDVFTLELGDEWNKPSWIINPWPLSKTAKTLAHFYETGANAVIVPQRQIPAQFLDPKVKSRSRVHLQLANIQASKLGKDALALLLDDHGFITEGTGSNFMIVKNGKLIVPEQRNMLRGCSMTYILKEIFPQLARYGFFSRYRIVEKNIEPYDVLEADEAFFTGTFTNLIPCNRINGQFIAGYRPENGPMGPLTKKICEIWSANVGIDFIQQVKDWDTNSNG